MLDKKGFITFELIDYIIIYKLRSSTQEAEEVGLENRKAFKSVRGFKSYLLRHLYFGDLL